MKKHFLLFVIVFLALALQAQNGDLYSFMYHDQAIGYIQGIINSMQQRNGDYIIDTYLIEDDGQNLGVPFGNMCYKISPATLAITDSLFVADTALPRSLLARDPRGEGNIRAIFEYHEDSDSTFVRISHFPDNDFHTNPEEDIVVPICEGITWEGRGFLLDCRDDLIMTYHKTQTEISSDLYIVRIGIDGTLKQQALLAENIESDPGPLRMFKESPLQYYQSSIVSYNPYNPNLAFYVIDSLFHRNTVILNRILSEEYINQYSTVYEYLTIGYDTEVIPAGGDDVLVAAQYTYDTNFYGWTQDRGVAVAKYDTRTMQLKGHAVFNDFHAYSSIGTPMGLKMMDDGTVYFLYKEYLYPEESIMVVKMDVNLNVEWKRFCKTENIIISSTTFESPILFEDETGEEKGIAWCGYGHKGDNSGWVYFLLYHDGTVGLNESSIELRPYMFYPNPAQDQLHLDFCRDLFREILYI